MVRFGQDPFLECSSRGDKRFSAFYARIQRRGNKSIAKDLNTNPHRPGLTYKVRKQYWRDGDHWWVEASDGAGLFKGAHL